MWGLRQRKRRWPTADDNKPHINMAAAAAGYGPRCRKFQNVASDRSGMIARSSEYAFYRLVAGINPKNTPMARQDSCRHRRTTGAFYGLYTGSSPVKCIFACSGHRLRSIRRNGPGFLTTYAVLGGHFRRRRPWWWCWLFSYDRLEKVLNPPYVVDLNF
jgi:hypothetical protein